MQRAPLLFLVLFASLIVNGVLAYLYSTSAQECRQKQARLETALVRQGTAADALDLEALDPEMKGQAEQLGRALGELLYKAMPDEEKMKELGDRFNRGLLELDRALKRMESPETEPRG